MLAVAAESISGGFYGLEMLLLVYKGQRVDTVLRKLNAAYFRSKHFFHPQTM